MNELVKIINNIKNESSRNGKELLLNEYKDNDEFVDVLKFVYDPFIVTGISSKKLNKKIVNNDVSLPNSINGLMNYLKNNNTGKDSDVNVVQQFIKLNEEFKELIGEIVCNSLKICVTEKTINKVLGKNTIPSFSVMLAESYAKKVDKVKGDFTLTLKLDGNRMVAIKEHGKVKFFSRKGQPIDGLIQLEKEFENLLDNYVYDGEVLLRNDDNLPSDQLFRATQKVIKKDGNKENVIFHVFDMLPLDEFKQGKSKLTYSERRSELFSLEYALDNMLSEYIQVLPALYVGSDKEKISEYLQIMIDQDKEGVMVNLNDGYYETKRSNALLKVKEFHSCDGVIKGVYEGTGKNKGKLGGINITFNDIVVNIGSGFTDNERIEYWNDPSKIIGKIGEYQYFEESKNQNGGTDLRFATWKGLRFDKGLEDVNYE